MTRNLLSALATLTLVGCGSTEAPVTASRELDPVEGASMVVQSQQALRGQQEDGEELVARSVIEDDNGAQHVRFDKLYRGLRVIGGDFVAHHNPDGTLRETFGGPGSGASLKGLSMRPVIDAAGATVLAEAAFEGQRVGSASAELVISAREQAPVLAWEVVMEGFQPDRTPSELHVLVNAHTGKVLEKWDMVHTAAATGTGNSLYSGSVSVGSNSLTSGYELRDVTRGSFYTVNLNGGTSGGSVFTDADNVWGNGSTSSSQSAGVDAHYGQMKTYDYYKNIHGRSGINGTGGSGYSRVHYSSQYNNAFWSDSCFCMTYGDGDGTTFSPLVSLDVAGHEMTHGVTSRTAKLVYSGESGGLNEATSDIFGSMVEFYAANASDAGDYLIGEKIRTPGTAGDALRYMYNPSLDGKSANCWSSTVGSLNVHYSSGVANHFFYLLAQGSAATPASPTCNGTSVVGIGRAAAEKIWYRALTVYMTSSTNYAGARQATLKAAADLYGSTSTQYSTVAKAWSAVSVN